MKNIFKYMAVSALIVSTIACQDQTEIYEDFVNQLSDRNYPGKVLEPTSFSGKNRVKIEVLTPGDPAVNEARVFWNFYADSISVPVTQTNAIQEIMLDNLPEDSYSFIIKTYDTYGNISIPVEVFGTSYGDNYAKLISNRTLLSSNIDPITGTLSLSFSDADISNGAVETQITYINTSDVEVTTTLMADEKNITIEDYKSGGEFATVFLPDSSSIDTFITTWENIE